MTWPGRPLISHDVIVNSIAATNTTTGLRIHAELDTAEFPTGVKTPDKELKALKSDGVLNHHIGTRNGTLNPQTARVEN